MREKMKVTGPKCISEIKSQIPVKLLYVKGENYSGEGRNIFSSLLNCLSNLLGTAYFFSW